MITESDLIAIAIGLIIGLALGFLLARVRSDEAIRTRELENQLADREKELGKYKEQVIEHFSKTSDLVNKLTDNYKEVHDHLRMSAVELCNDEFSRHLLSISPPKSATNTAENIATKEQANTEDVMPPKDYAPKANPTASGTLDEEYGLEKVDLHESKQSHTEEGVN